MSMVFCRGCGKQIHVTATACPGCGAVQPGTASVAAAQVALRDSSSKLWATRFALIEKAGGSKLPKLWELPFREVWKVKANLLAFLFGVFYYIAKGMWKKGLTLQAIAIVAVFVLAVIFEAIGWSPDMLWIFAAAFMSGHANASYYRFAKEGHTGWW